jgi:preprotein translocase subunit SecE
MASMSKNPVEFMREVRAEVGKVTWPTRRETMITTSMVFIFVVIAAIFFLLADKVIGFVIKTLLGVA